MKKFFIILLAVSAAAVLLFFSLEPRLTVADSSVATTTVTLVVSSEISLSASSTIAMSPNISMSQDTAIGSGNFNVKTNDTAGYTLSLHASSSPALNNSDNSFADYTEAVEGTPEAWSVATGAYEFGFSAYGADVSDATWDSGISSCGSAGADSLTTNVKWMGFNGTTPVSGVATKNSETSQAGSDVVLCVAAEQGDSVYAPSGTYYATIVGTATTQ